jgi:hypothetical protein
MGRVPLKNAYTVVYERPGTELVRYSLTAFNPDEAEVDADRRFESRNRAIVGTCLFT